MTHKYHPSQQDKQTGHTGKAQNDTNKLGKGQTSQVNEGQRTPESRHDREDHIGNNQGKMRRGTTQGGAGQPTKKGM
ncbi:hypothetical protein [Ramlibacter sp. AN1133]|uniref:hypothetical protein n=1 Tax=Ramlibacter sp. AN1133 TaxID=3133429 RepID=UPI0030BB0558